MASLLWLAAPVLLAQRGGCRDQEAEGWQVEVAGPEEPGDRLLLRGLALTSEGEPAAGVRVRVFHTDAEGYYSVGGMDERNARLCGVLETAENGAWEVSTILPAAYATGGGPAPHIHFDVDSPTGRGRLYTVSWTDVEEKGDPEDGDRRASRRPLVRTDEGLVLVYDFVLP